LEFGVKPNEIMNNCLSESGKAYGLVTVDAQKKYISKERIVANIKVLYKYARKNSDKLFYVAYDGKYPDAISLNGKSRKVLASLFFQAGMDLYLRIPENIVFEKDFHILIYGSLNIASFYI